MPTFGRTGEGYGWKYSATEQENARRKQQEAKRRRDLQRSAMDDSQKQLDDIWEAQQKANEQVRQNVMGRFGEAKGLLGDVREGVMGSPLRGQIQASTLEMLQNPPDYARIRSMQTGLGVGLAKSAAGELQNYGLTGGSLARAAADVAGRQRAAGQFAQRGAELDTLRMEADRPLQTLPVATNVMESMYGLDRQSAMDIARLLESVQESPEDYSTQFAIAMENARRAEEGAALAAEGTRPDYGPINIGAPQIGGFGLDPSFPSPLPPGGWYSKPKPEETPLALTPPDVPVPPVKPPPDWNPLKGIPTGPVGGTDPAITPPKFRSGEPPKLEMWEPEDGGLPYYLRDITPSSETGGTGRIGGAITSIDAQMTSLAGRLREAAGNKYRVEVRQEGDMYWLDLQEVGGDSVTPIAIPASVVEEGIDNVIFYLKKKFSGEYPDLLVALSNMT